MFHLVAAMALAIFAGAQDPSDLERVVGAHVEARGGAAALDAIQSTRLELEIIEGGHTLRAVYLARLAPVRMRIDVYAEGQLVFSEGLDAEGAWVRSPPDAAQPAATPDATRALINGVENNLLGLHRFMGEEGRSLVLEAPQVFEGRTQDVIALTHSTGHRKYVFLDRDTHMIVRAQDERAYHPDIDNTAIGVESRYGDFVREGGVTTSRLNHDYNSGTGELMATARVLSRRNNVAAPVEAFQRGAEPSPL